MHQDGTIPYNTTKKSGILIKNRKKLVELRALLQSQIASLQSGDFEEIALQVFRFQSEYNPYYRDFLAMPGILRRPVQCLEDIPCMPISVFRSQEVQTLSWVPEAVFTSSGTTGMQSSRHLVRELSWYSANALRCFSQFYGPVEQYAVLALLPAYLERSGSSLVYMAQDFIQRSPYLESGFFLHEQDKLRRVLEQCRDQGIPTLLLGVSFALWDFVESSGIDFPELIVMETGGMKGRREEITREALHEILKEGFGVSVIHSEYGMTELLSQAYSQGNGVFHCPPSLQVRAREIYDPFEMALPGRSGLLNIIDLANLDTLSFIATDDLGRMLPGGGFEVIGRLDYSEIRGCNLMVNG